MNEMGYGNWSEWDGLWTEEIRLSMSNEAVNVITGI